MHKIHSLASRYKNFALEADICFLRWTVINCWLEFRIQAESFCSFHFPNQTSRRWEMHKTCASINGKEEQKIYFSYARLSAIRRRELSSRHFWQFFCKNVYRCSRPLLQSKSEKLGQLNSGWVSWEAGKQVLDLLSGGIKHAKQRNGNCITGAYSKKHFLETNF